MKRTVLNTRPREQAGELSRLLRAAGFEVVEAPAIQTVSAWDAGELQRTRVGLAQGAYAWVVLPSQNAARAIVDDLRRGRAVMVCGVSSARALGLQPEFALARFSALTALEVLRPLVLAGQAILVPRAAEASEELVEQLRSLGAHVDAPIAYRTLGVEPWRLAEAAALLGSGAVDILTACSPSAVAALVAAVGSDACSAARLICLGTTTAAAARLAGLRVDRVAERTSMAALVEAVREALSEPAVPV